MKKLFFNSVLLAAAALMFGGQAQAELVLMTSSGGSFTFDPTGAMGGSSLVANGDNGLDDLSFTLGFQTGPIGGQSTDFAQLSTGTFSTSAGNIGQFVFDTVSFGNGVSVDAVVDFTLIDATGAIGSPQSQLLYQLSLETTGVDATTEGSLQSFVGFDFNGDGTDALLGSTTVSGFGPSQVNIGDADRSLFGDFTFPAGQGPATVDSDNTNVDIFQGPVGSNLAARFNGVFDGGPGTGDLAFGAFSNFDARAADQTDVTAGVIGFQSTTAPSPTIPEPSALMLAASGLGMVAFRRRRRNA